MKRIAKSFWLCLVAFSVGACQTGLFYDPAPLKFNVGRFIHGMSASREDCAKHADRVWVTVEKSGYCIRYFGADLTGTPEIVQVYFTGDLTTGDVWDLYDRYTPTHLKTVAEDLTLREDIPHVYVARPGTFGSSGNHGEDNDRTVREARIMNAAVDLLKEKYGLRSLSLVGQSGGGHIVAYLAAHRSDVVCATMASAPLSLDHMAKDRFWREGFDEYAEGFWDPIKNLDAVAAMPKRRLFVLADRRDQVVPFDGAQAYADQARAAGADVSLIEAKARGQDSHGLSAAGVQIGVACSKGVSTEKILREHQS